MGQTTTGGSPALSIEQKLALGALTMFYAAVLAAKLGRADTDTASSPWFAVADVAFTVLIVAVAVLAANRVARLAAWVTLFASAADGLVDLPRAVIEMHPAWLVTESFYVVLPLLVWRYQHRLAQLAPRRLRR